MKRLFLVLSVVILTTCSGEDDPEAEREKIMEVIRTETRSYFTFDFETWKKSFLDTTYFIYAGYWDGYHDSKGIRYFTGYDSFTETARTDFDKRRKLGADWPYEVAQYKNLNIQIDGSLAYATFTETAFNKLTKESYPGNFQVRVLQKENNEWKISYMGVYFLPADVKAFNLPLTYRPAD